MLLFGQTATGQSNIEYRGSPPIICKFNAGLGIGTKNIGLLSSIMYSCDNMFYSIRYSMTSEFKLFGPVPEEQVWDLGFIYGTTLRWGSSSFSYGVGLSYVHQVRRGALLHSSSGFLEPDQYETIRQTGVGIPIQIEFTRPLFSFLGGGIIGFADINSVNSFAGIAAVIEIGKLR